MIRRFSDFRLLLAWCIAIFCSYFFGLGFLGGFYPTLPGVFLSVLIVQCLTAIFALRLLVRLDALRNAQSVDFFLCIALALGLIFFTWRMFELLSQYPQMFDAQALLPESGQIWSFLGSSVLTLFCLAWLDRKKIIQNRFAFADAYLPGAALAGIFFTIYFQTALTFNQPVFDVDDIFFDADGLLWRTRFTTETVVDYYWRSVHPFVLILIRPLVAFISFFLRGDKLTAAIALISITGALCVFLVWYFVQKNSGHSLYALLIAAIFGASAAQLVFSSLIETYIFLAVTALLFTVFLLSNAPFGLLVTTSVLSFGITLSNFVQQLIGFICVRRNFREWIKFGALAGLLILPLTFLNNFVYPKSQPYFFIPSSLNAEAENTFAPSVPRALAVARVMAMYSMVAPDPLILAEEIPFLKVWIFKAEPMRLSEYATSLDTALAASWIVLILLGGFLFLKNFARRDNRFSLTFLLILLFNFFLHLRYGKDVFLYSTNWTYALVLLLSIAWADLAKARWFQIVLLIFVFLLLANNFRLIEVMLYTSARHIQ
ncbi:MAG: hypothetical protein IT311_13150 [Anaerolineales bacterium]|nr:hypothetical protein [Anaerolineales bacterium]